MCVCVFWITQLPLFPLFLHSGCGVKKVSVVNMRASQYVPIHSKQIRGLSFNRQNDSLLLSAALDNTIKLTRYEHVSISSLTEGWVVRACELMCCCFVPACWPTRWFRPIMRVNQCGAAAGVWTTVTTSTPAWATALCSSTTRETPARTCRSSCRCVPGTQKTYEGRASKTKSFIKPQFHKFTQLKNFELWVCDVSRCPVASLCYVPRAASSSFPCGGLLAGSLEGGCFWEQVNEATYRPHVLPLETSGCTDIQVETESRHCLVTYRPGKTLTPQFLIEHHVCR